MILFSAFQSDLDWGIKKISTAGHHGLLRFWRGKRGTGWCGFWTTGEWTDRSGRSASLEFKGGVLICWCLCLEIVLSSRTESLTHVILAASFEHCLPYHAIPYHMTAFNEGWRLGEAGEWLAIISCGPTIVIFLRDIFDPKETFVTAKLRCRNMQKPCSLGTIVFALMLTFWTTCEAETQLVPNHPNQPTNPNKDEVLVAYLGENSCEPKLLEWMTGR